MKVVILAGGQQSTIDERAGIPKPMAEIGERPLLWHIMKQFSFYGYNDFIICGGYGINMIKDYFMDYYIYQSDITVDLASNEITIHNRKTESWRVTVVDTGLYSATGQRVSRVQPYIEEENFLVTYGDCLSDINIQNLVEVHNQNDKIVTMAVAKPSGRNMIMDIHPDGRLAGMGNNTPEENQAWVNACTFVFNSRIFRYLQGNYELDLKCFPELADQDQVMTSKHYGFWNAVETKRDKVNLENLWNAGMAPWKVWD